MKSKVVSLPIAKLLAPHLPEGFECALEWQRFKAYHTDKKFGLWAVGASGIWHGRKDACQKIPAPILEELLDLEMLPAWIDNRYWLHTDKNGVSYVDDKFKALIDIVTTEEINRATALGMVILWLIENKHIGG